MDRRLGAQLLCAALLAALAALLLGAGSAPAGAGFGNGDAAGVAAESLEAAGEPAVRCHDEDADRTHVTGIEKRVRQ